MSARKSGSAGFVLFASAAAALGGFLFGYDTAVINGANSFLQSHFRLDPKLDAGLIGLATASAIIGCIPGAMSAGFFSDRFGRRKVLLFCAVLYAASGILSAIPQTFTQFIAARILSGVAIGISSMICPVYIAEIAPPPWRGRLGSLFQLCIVTGIFVTLFINGAIQRPADAAWNADYGWRWMLAIEAFPAFVFLALLLPVPESPRWLVQAGREDEARRILHRLGGDAMADSEIAAVKRVLAQEQASLGELFSRSHRLPLLIAFVLMVGSQFSGINVIMYYSTEIFKNAAGVGPVAARVAAFRSNLAEASANGDPAGGQKQIEAALAAIQSPELKGALDPLAVADVVRALEQGATVGKSQELQDAARAALKLAGNGVLKKRMDDIEQQSNAKAFSCSVWIGLVNLLATFIAILLVDKAGRKPLLLAGNAVQVIGLGCVGWLFHVQSQSTVLLLAFVMVYIGAFAMGMGPLPWIVCSEIFPARLRGRAMSAATFCIWTACLVVAQSFPVLLQRIGPAWAFWTYGLCSAATFLFILLRLPETKGRALEEIEMSWRNPLRREAT